MRIFLAGATGAIGRRLVPLLLGAGHDVTGSTRSREKAGELSRRGITPVVVDMFDQAGVRRALAEARPEILIHQLTDLPKVFDPAQMEAARARNARLRAETTPVLLEAARQAGVRRAIVQSICFVYAPGRVPHDETDPINSPSVQVLEDTTLRTPGIDGVVLRYGRLWGPGTWADNPGEAPNLHVDAAAHAALLAITRGAPGVYNIAEDDGAVTITKAVRELGFDPGFRAA
ncbi:MAG TPA: NAD(P)-dependent oxidoreductase [Lacunisphaera sp.]|nr:NAD(P)-dependent oxidoreductase [Lacunisphaera sp.]